MDTTYRGRPVRMLAGWDGIEWHLFAKVAWLDEDGAWDDDAPLVLDCWIPIDVRPEPDEARQYVMALTRRVAAQLGIELPPAMQVEICRAMLDNDNRSQVWFAADGSVFH